MDSTGCRFDEDGRFVGEVLRNGVQLALVGHEGERPTAARLFAVAGLQPRRYVATRQVDAVSPPAVGTSRAQRFDASRLAAKDRLYHDSSALLCVRHHLVARHEREAHYGLEPPRRAPVHRCQVAPTDARHPWQQPLPAWTRQLRRRYVHQTERAVAPTGSRFPLGGDARHGEARHRAFDLKRLHDSLRPLGALVWLITGPKGRSARL